MTCPSCNSPLEPNARFCGVCGYRLAPRGQVATPVTPERVRGGANASGNSGGNSGGSGHSAGHGGAGNAGQPRRPPGQTGAPPQGKAAAGEIKAALSASASQAQKQLAARVPAPKPRPKSTDDVYLGQVLNNRFKVESKIGEGGFGAVYRGVQLATGRKVALKLLHPDMTKDDNLVARFRREGMVLCNLRDAHTITTYDFDQTPSGTLYIAMELLEGKSLHQVFHEEAPLEWKRVFKVLTEMCSSLAEAHTQGIVHRDLKPENIYLESRSGNPEFVKILDFGIAKVMRGETIDPQSPQLTATGQTLGTLEYMSPEQLMGKALDGRSDVYALGVLAYEMITGRLPFPDAKGPAGLITAQLKQTPAPPSQAYPQADLPPAADRAILKCLEKDKNNRFPDVSALAIALQDVIAGQAAEAVGKRQVAAGSNRAQASTADMLETRRGDLPNLMPPPPMPISPSQAQIQARPLPGLGSSPGAPSPGLSPPGVQPPGSSPALSSPGAASGMQPPQALTPPGMPGSGLAMMQGGPGASIPTRDRPPTPPPVIGPGHQPAMTPPVGSPVYPPQQLTPPYQLGHPIATYPVRHPPAPAARRSSRILWWVIALLAIGAAGGTVAGLLMRQ
jgi:serine/threonine-protein kinase